MICFIHYSDVIMGAMASHITGVLIVYSTVCSGADQKTIKAPSHWPLWGEFTGDRWIPLTKGQWLRKIFPFVDVIMFEIVLPWKIETTHIWRYTTPIFRDSVLLSILVDYRYVRIRLLYESIHYRESEIIYIILTMILIKYWRNFRKRMISFMCYCRVLLINMIPF